MEYIGEHSFIGNIGQAFISIAFVAAILAAFCFYKASKNTSDQSDWRKVARASFIIHGISVIGIVATLFIMIYNHYLLM